MRKIMNISLPREMAMQIKEETKKRGFASQSEFMRYLFRAWNTMELAREVEKADKEKRWKKLPKGKILR